MTSISDLMKRDHRACDDEFARIETAAARHDWSLAADAGQQYKVAMERHLGAEEEVLFPAFEKASGMVRGGPTEMMRREHEQIRNLIEDLLVSIEAHEEGDCRGCAETLLIMMQQHNMKEENILYPACDEYLHRDAKGIYAVLLGAVERVVA